MTDKEEKAIERCNQLIKVEHANWIGISNQVAIETVLNLIQTQQEEIEILKQEKATAWEEWNIIDEYCEQEKQKYKAELEKKDTLINTMQAEFERLEDLEDNTDMLKLELQKKDKIIDEIAKTLKWVLNVGLGFIPSSICTCKEDIRNCEDKICTDCIKKHFINKVEKENKDE